MRRTLFCILLAGATLRAQSILTVAGGGPIGDGKVAAEAVLKLPQDVAVDASGNIYFADSTNHRIRKVDAGSGVITTFAGGGTSGPGDGGLATAGVVPNPNSVAVDRSGNVYVAEPDRVRRIDVATGIIQTYAGGGTTDGDGGLATAAVLRGPAGITFDAQGNLYIAENTGAAVRRVAAGTGIITTVAGGQRGFSGDGGPATAAALEPPLDVAADGAGNLYIADQQNQRIRKVSADTGIITTIAGTGARSNSGDGGPALAASVFNPNGIAVDASGNVFVAVCCASIRKIDGATGIISTARTAGRTAPMSWRW